MTNTKYATAMTAERIAQQLGSAKRNGSGWLCKCPCHDDKKASLSIADGRNGKIILHCFAGCDTETKIIPRLKELKLWPESQTHRKPTSIHEYTDEDGVVSFEVCRYSDEPKALTRHYDRGKKDYVWNAKGCTRYLYKLPEVLKAKEVFLVEGEKDADALRNLGLCATTAPFGAAAPWPPEYTQSLKGKIVYALPDNDKPGRDHKYGVAWLLERAKIRCKVIELPQKKKGGDVRDWLAAGGTKAKLLSMVQDDATHKWYKTRDVDSPDMRKKIKARAAAEAAAVIEGKVVTIRASDVVMRPVNWLWKDRIPRGKVTLLASDPGLAKSTITVSWAATVTAPNANWRACRWPDGERRSGGPTNVIILSAEDDNDDTICPRLTAAGADLKRVEIVESVMFDATGELPESERVFSLEADLKRLEAKIEEIGDVSMVIIDPISSYMGSVDSYKNTEVRSLLAPFVKLAQKKKFAVVLITHLNKSESKDWKSISGSIALYALSRAAYLVMEDPRDDDSEFKKKLLFCIKNNLAAPQPMLVYNTVPVIVPSDEGPIDVTRIKWEDSDKDDNMSLEEAMAVSHRKGKDKEASPKQQEVIDLLTNEPDLTAKQIADKLGWDEDKNHRVFLARMVIRKQLVRKDRIYNVKS